MTTDEPVAEREMRVLLIEHDSAFADSLREMLADAPGRFAVTATGDLAQGIELLKKEPYDVVCLDVDLPGSPANETFSHMRYAFPAVPMVVIAGREDQSLSATMARRGVWDYLVKDRINGRLLAWTLKSSVERKSVKRDLTYSKEVYDQILTTSSDGLVIVDGDGCIRFANPAAERMFGIPGAKLQGYPLGSPVLAEDRAEINIVRPDGRPLTAELRASGVPVRGPGHHLLTIRDITELKWLEEMRCVSVQRADVSVRVLRLLNSGGTKPSIIGDILRLVKGLTSFEAVAIRLQEGDDFPYYATNGFPPEFVEADRRACAHDAGGRAPCDERGLPLLECLCGSVILGRTDPTQRHFTTGGSFWTDRLTKWLADRAQEYWRVPVCNRCNSDGYESVALVPLRSGDRIMGLLQLNDHRPGMLTSDLLTFLEGIGANIGAELARREANEKLRESELKLRTIFNSASDGMFLVEPDSRRLALANVACLRMLGYSAEEFESLSIADLHPQEDLPLVSAQIEECVKGGQGRRGDTRFRRKDGSLFPADMSPAEMALDSRKFLLITFRDRTERKQAEEERGRLNRELDVKDEELEQIVFVISHDLRSHVVGIEGFVRELVHSLGDLRAELDLPDVSSSLRARLAEVVDHDVPEALKFIQTGVSQVKALLAGLLRLSRVGRVAPQRETLDMNRLVADAARTLKSPEHEVAAKIDVAELPSCVGDPYMVAEVFTSLLDNALKYRSPDRPLVIRITGQRDGGNAVYCVEDDGIGIAPDQQQRMFTPFYHSDPRAVVGEDLGLTIVTRIVERLGGRVRVESELGKGSRFYVALPVGE